MPDLDPDTRLVKSDSTPKGPSWLVDKRGGRRGGSYILKKYDRSQCEKKVKMYFR